MSNSRESYARRNVGTFGARTSSRALAYTSILPFTTVSFALTRSSERWIARGFPTSAALVPNRCGHEPGRRLASVLLTLQLRLVETGCLSASADVARWQRR